MRENLYKYKKLIFYIGVLLIFTGYLIYLFHATDNVPIMDYWRYINLITEKIFSGEFSLQDCYESYSGHKAGLNMFLLFLNIKFFHYNTLIEIFGGAVVSLIIAGVLIKLIKDSLSESIYEWKTILFIWFIIYYIFSLNKWEIITLEFSLAFSLRILSYIFIFKYIDYKIKNNIKFSWDIILFAILFYFVVIFMSGAYFAGMIIAFGTAIIAKLFFDREANKKRTFLLGTIFFIIVLISAISYLKGGNIVDTGKEIDIFLTIKGTLIMLASGIIHENIAMEMGSFLMTIVGCILFAGYFIAIVKYLKHQCFKKTWIPFMLIVYALFSCLIVSYGRTQEFNIMYLSSSRYVYETSLGGVGFIWIYLLLRQEKSKKKISKIYIHLVIFICVCFNFLTFIKEGKTAPYRKIYAENCISMMYDIEHYTDEELAVFQGNNAQQVRDGVELLKKYKLGIFSKDNIMSGYEYSKKYNFYIKGEIYNDNWIGEEAEFYINPLKNTSLILKGYYPFDIEKGLKIRIYIDEKYDREYVIEQNNFEIKINIEQSTSLQIKLNCDFAKIRNENDKRKLSFVLEEIIYE